MFRGTAFARVAWAELSNGCHPCCLSGACHIREYGHTFQLVVRIALVSSRLRIEIRLSIHLAFAKVYDDGWLASFNAHRSTCALAFTTSRFHACDWVVAVIKQM